MRPLPIVLLPGLDGTAKMFERFLASTPGWAEPRPVALSHAASFEGLRDDVLDEIADLEEFLVVGESFSGPVSLLVAEAAGARCRGVVLVASFVRPVVARAVRWLPLSMILSFPPPGWVVRRRLAGNESSRELVEQVRSSMREVSSRVIAQRIRMISRLSLAVRLEVPVLYLRATADRLVSADAADRVVRAIPHTVVEEIDGPHLLLQTRPDECWRALGRVWGASAAAR